MFFKIGLIAMMLLPFHVFAQQGATYQSASSLLEVSYGKFETSNFDKAIEYGLKGLAEAEEIQDDGLSLQFKSILGNSYLENKEYKIASNYFLQIALLAKQEKNDVIAANGYMALAKVYVEMQAFKKSAETYDAAAGFFAKTDDSESYVNAKTAVAFNYLFAKEYNLAENTFKQLIDRLKNDEFYVSSFNEQLGIIYEDQKQYNKAINALQVVYKFSQSEGDRSKEVQVARKIAELYTKTGNGSKSLEFAKLALAKSPNNIESNRLLGEAYIANKNYDQAITSLVQTVNLVRASPNAIQKPIVYKWLAKAYQLSEKPQNALDAIKQAENAVAGQQLLDEKEEIYSLGAEIAVAVGDIPDSKRYKALYNSAVAANKKSKQQELATLIRYDNRARANESELTLSIAQKFSSDFVNKSRELTDERGRQAKELRSKSFELADTREANAELKRLQQYQDSVIAANQKTVAEISKDNEELSSNIKEIDKERIDAMNEVEAKTYLITQQEKISKQEREKAAQDRIFFWSAIVGIVLILMVILYAYFKTNQSRKIITQQNVNLESQQNVIKKRNSQLKKSSDHLLKSNNKLKRTQLSLKSSLSKEQQMRTELESINSELKNTQVQLIHAEKMSSLGQLTAGIAHEINNPINFVLNSANIIGMNFGELKEIFEHFLVVKEGDKIVEYSKTLDKEEIKDSIEIIEEMLGNLKYGADRVTEIVKGLRTFSRFDEAEIKTVDIHENLESSLLILHNKYSDHNIAIVKEFDEKLPEIECYPGQLNQVFVNIINNAIDVIANKESPEITIGTYFEEDKVMIFIKDNGPGIPEDVQSKIFDPFFTTKEVGEGTGLGLSISHSIVQQHKGLITVDSRLGEGTKFTIALPKNLYNSTNKQQAVAAN